jgi:hypothetical protein
VYREYTAPPEQKIAFVVDAMRQAIEAGSPGELMSHFSDRYWDGTNAKMDIRRLALQALQQGGQYSVVVEDLKFDPFGPGTHEVTAHIKTDFWLKQEYSEAPAWTFSVNGVFERTWRGWKVISLTGWQAAIDKELGE